MPTAETPTAPALTLFGIEYARPKSGKTQNAVWSFPAATFFGQRDAIEPLVETAGWAPTDIREVDSIPNGKTVTTAVEQVTATLLDEAPQKIARGELPIFVIDDLTLIVQNSVRALETVFGGNVRDLYGTLFDQIVDMRDAAIAIGAHVWITAHLMGPEVRDGIFKCGGPELPGKNAKSIAAKVQTIAFTEADTKIKFGWKLVYRIDPTNKDYYSGDRWGMIYDGAPHNIGELMRGRGFFVPRVFDWQEEIVDAVASELLNLDGKRTDFNDKEKKILEDSWAMLDGSYPPAHILWTLRDARDRARITRANATKHKSLLLGK